MPHTLHNLFLNQAHTLEHGRIIGPIRIGWQSPSNIALIKYWGKKAEQIPSNASLSITLSRAFTEVIIEVLPGNQKELNVDFYFEGKRKRDFLPKIVQFLSNIKIYFPFLQQLYIKMESRNTFPHSSGIASSASSMSAIALTICTLEENLFEKYPTDEFMRKASYIARIGSGSACRSIYGGFVSWGKHQLLKHSSDEVATPLTGYIHPIFHNLKNSVLIVSSSKKKVSSTQGHRMMENHPFAAARFTQANTNMVQLLSALESGDFPGFAKIVENEALTLHGLMMSYDQGIILTEPGTFRIINEIKEFRESSGINICYTLDAGPNVHLIYPEEINDRVQGFIRTRLLKFCENNKWIDDSIGSGPKYLSI